METTCAGSEMSEIMNGTTPTNGSDMEDFDSPRKYSLLVQYSALVIGVPAITLGFVGNLMTIVVVAKTPVLRTPTNLFIISLSVSDLLYCSITLPVVLTVYMRNAWVFGATYCQVHPILMFTFVGATMTSLVGTAFGRYLKITQSPLFGKLFTVKKRAALMVLFCWCLPLFFLIPPITGIWGQLGYEPKTLTCTFLRGGRNSGYSMFFMICALIIPIASITFCYLRIFQTVRRNHKRVRRMRRDSVTQTSGSSTTASDTGSIVKNRRQQRKIYREDIQYTKMMLCIFLVFIGCYAPYMLATLIDPEVKNLTFHFYFSTCVWFSSVLNPIVYVAMNKHFRRAYSKVLSAVCGRVRQTRG